MARVRTETPPSPAPKAASAANRPTARRGTRWWPAVLASALTLATLGGSLLLVSAGLEALAGTDRVAALPPIDATPVPEWIAAPVIDRCLAVPPPASDVSAVPKPVQSAPPPAARLAQLAARFRDDPWIRAVRLAVWSGRLRVEVDYRRPVACLPWGAMCCYVDQEAVVLPPDEIAPEALRACLLIEGLRQGAEPRVGLAYDDPNAAAAAELASFLLDHRQALGLQVIELIVGAELSFDLKTVNNSRIRWGMVGTLEDNRRRLHLLLGYLRDHGGLEEPAGPYEFDVTGPELPPPARLVDTRKSQP